MSLSPTVSQTGLGRSVRQSLLGWSTGAGAASVRALKVLGWLIIVFLATRFVTEDVPKYLQPIEGRSLPNPQYAQNLHLLLPHIIAGSFALLLGPWQFWSTLRNRYRLLHRWIGRVYLLSILVASISALGLSRIAFGGAVGRTGLGTLALVWLATGLMAYAAIRRGEIDEHREWMIRSYVVTFAFVTFRLVRLTGLGLSFSESFALKAWAVWAIPLFITEICLSMTRQRAKRARVLRVRLAEGERAVLDSFGSRRP